MSSSSKSKSGRKPLVFHYGSAESHKHQVQKEITDKVDLEIILFEPKRRPSNGKNKSPVGSDTNKPETEPEEDLVAKESTKEKSVATKSPLIDKHLLDQMESRFRGSGGANGENVYIDYMDYF